MPEEVDVFISAENPNYNVLPENKNEQRMAALYSYLRNLNSVRGLDLKIYPATFVDEKNGYVEHSFFVKNIPIGLAIKLARYYGQASIVVDGMGLLDVNTMTVAPQTKKYVGERAGKRSAYSVIKTANGKRLISYDFDFDHQSVFVP